MGEQSKTENRVHATIDGIPVAVAPGTTIIEAAKQVGIEIPHYCYDRDLSIVASCRLCLVEIEKVPKLQPACSTPIMEGQTVFTKNDAVLEARRMQMEFLLVQHPLDCPVCDQGGECKLQDYSMVHGCDASRFRFPKRTFPKPDIGPFIDLERNRCILCTRCVRFMEEVAGEAELAVIDRGNGAHIATFEDQPLKNEFAGNTIDLCPVGALTSKITRFRARVWELKSSKSVCTLCPVGCNVFQQYRNRTHEVLRIVPRENDAVNHRWICDMGRFGFDPFNSSERERVPLLKKDNEFERISWSSAIETTITTFKDTVQSHSPHAVAGLIGPRHSNETLFLFQQWFREAVGSPNIDHRLDRVTTAQDDAYCTSLALGAVNQPLNEIQRASTILMIGADLPNEVPILHLAVRKQVAEGTRLFSANAYQTRLDSVCTDTLTYAPGSETALLAGLIYYVTREQGVVVSEELKSFINKIRITRIAERTGIDKKKIQEWAQLLLEDEHITVLLGASILSSKWSSQTVRITAELLSLLNENEHPLPISVLLPFANSRGAMDMGCLPHRGLGFEPLEEAGKSTTEILQGCIDGSIQALFLFDADVMEDYPDQPMVEKALATVPFVVCAGSYQTKTTDYASVFLPLSMVSEEDGTYTNFSGRVQRSLKALPQLDGSLSGCQLLLALGERWGLSWKQVRASQITNMIAQAVPHYGGLTWENIGHEGKASQDVAKKYVETIPGLVLPEDAVDEDIPEDFPYRWVWGAFLFDLSGNKPYAKALVERSEPCTVRIHPSDANELGVKENSSLTVKGDLGEVKLLVEITSATAPGCVTVLGKYKDIAVNRIASPERPWVKISR